MSTGVKVFWGWFVFFVAVYVIQAYFEHGHLVFYPRRLLTACILASVIWVFWKATKVRP